MKGKTILLVEDDEKVQAFNRQLLQKQGFTTFSAETLADAGKLFAATKPDIIVLDIGMPDGNGLDFLKKLRRTYDIPVLMLTGYNKDSDVVQGFESGCDDYLTKPYTFEVLHARINRLLRSAERVPERITKGVLSLDITATAAYLRGDDMLLTNKEFSLLMLFVQNEDKVMSTEYLGEKVWGAAGNIDVRVLRAHISNLRKRLEKGKTGYTVRSVYGEGYSFEEI
jgi:DNA-binding response OmpR family regulator